MSWDFPHYSLKMAFCLVQFLVLAKKISTSTSARLACCGLSSFSSSDIYPSHKYLQVSTVILEFHCEFFSGDSFCRLEKLRTSQPTTMPPFEQQLDAERSVVAIPGCRWLKQRYIYACCVPWDKDCDGSHHC